MPVAFGLADRQSVLSDVISSKASDHPGRGVLIARQTKEQVAIMFVGRRLVLLILFCQVRKEDGYAAGSGRRNSQKNYTSLYAFGSATSMMQMLCKSCETDAH